MGPVTSPDLGLIDRMLCEAAVIALPLVHLEPTNSAQEEERVARDSKYNPQFTYRAHDPQIILLRLNQLERLEIPDGGVGTYFRQAREYLSARLRMRLHLGETEHWQEQIYPPPPPRIIALAQRLLNAPRAPRPPVERSFQAEDLMRIFRARLKQYRLDDWEVAVRPNISATNTDSANRLINIRADARYTMEEMKRLAVHEVDTHALRAANGYCQPYHIFAVGAVPSYLMTEEGLAVVNEERMGYIDRSRNRTFAGRVLAAARASTGSFAEIYAELRDAGFSHEESFVATKRVKRGLTDTSNPGGYIKDHAYLWGRILIEEYVLGGGDLSRLYIGKIALEHVPISREIGLRPARYIPYPYS